MTKAATDPDVAPFFHLRSTHMLIDKWVKLDPVTLYVGAGASIERTGLSWAGLSAQLLDSDLGDYSSRVELVRASDPLRISSAIAAQFEETRTDNWRERLRASIADQLYRGPANLTSYFNDRVVALAVELVASEKSVAIVTPNYDQFLVDAFDDLMDAEGLPEGLTYQIFAFGVDGDGNPTDIEPQLSEIRAALKEPRTVCLVYLHGFVGRESTDEPRLQEAYPVVSEADYSATRDNSQRILNELFTERNVVISGSSVTDPPLIHALISTEEKGAGTHGTTRYAIVPLAGSAHTLDGEARRNLEKVEQQRASALGVELIAPPFYFQASQLLEEYRVALNGADDWGSYSSITAQHRYGVRLGDWWWSWLYSSELSMEDRQKRAYHILRAEALPEIRRILNAPDSESIKVEAWIRWQPERRELALWASTNSTWLDFDSLRTEQIALNSPSAASRAFLAGAPYYMEGKAGSRWRAHLAKPIRFIGGPFFGYLPVGVISVVSIRPQHESSLNPRLRAATANLFEYLDGLGALIYDPTITYLPEGFKTKS